MKQTFYCVENHANKYFFTDGVFISEKLYFPIAYINYFIVVAFSFLSILENVDIKHLMVFLMKPMI